MVKQQTQNRQHVPPAKHHPIKKFERKPMDYGPPQRVLPYCQFQHACGQNIICRVTQVQYVPKFNRGIYLQNKTKIGTVDQIFGPIQRFYFSAVLQQGFTPASFKKGQVFHLGTEDALPVTRFTNPQKPVGGFKRGGPPNRGGFRGGPPRGRGGNFRGGNRGGSRGGGFRGKPRGK